MPNSYIGLPQSSIDLVAHDIATSELAVADTICTKNTSRTTLSGSIPVRKGLLVGGKNGGLARGVTAKNHDMSVGSANYQCLAYVGSTRTADEDVSDWTAWGEDELAESAKVARADSNMAVDLKLAEVLKDTGKNQEFDVTAGGDAEWDDYAASTPIEDMSEVLELYPGQDMIVYGVKTERVLASHPDFTAETSNYSGGSLDDGAVAQVISKKTGIPLANIHCIRGRIYNSADEGDDEVPKQVFADGFWMGRKANLHMVDPVNAAMNNVIEIERVVKARSHDIQTARYIDIFRSGDKKRGVIFKNIHS